MARTWNPKKAWAIRIARKKALIETQAQILREPAVREIIKMNARYFERDVEHILNDGYKLAQVRKDYKAMRKDFDSAWAEFQKALDKSFGRGVRTAVEKPTEGGFEKVAQAVTPEVPA